MATLNYNWQEIAYANGTINGNFAAVRIYAKINSQSITNNTSSVSYQSRLYYGGSYFTTYSPTTKSISGTGASSSTQDAQGQYNNGETTLQTITGTVTHNSSGNATVSMSGTFNSGPWDFNATASGTATLPQIKRIATVTNAPNFTDEDTNIEITFNNSANFQVQPYINFYLNGSLIKTIFRQQGNYTSPYTLEITQQEQEQLRNLLNKDNSCQAYIGLNTYSGSTNIGSNSVGRTFSIINANPVFNNFDYNDINSTTLALTGNSKYNINGYSTIRVAINTTNKAVAQKGATMDKYQFMIGTSTKEVPYSENETVYIDIPNSSVGEFKVYAIDSRKNTTLVTKLAENNINYENIFLDSLSSSVERSDSGIGEDVTLEYRGTIWNDSFGDVTNNITSVSYQYKETDSNTWITPSNPTDITPTITNNTMSFSGLIRSNESGYTFDVSKSYNFKITIQDELSSYEIILNPLPSGIPNISLNKDGVGIMCDYDTSLGGLLQVGGVVLDRPSLETIYTGTLKGGSSTTLSNVKRYLLIHAVCNNRQSINYLLDTQISQNNTIYSSGVSLAYDSSSGIEDYVSEASFDPTSNSFSHTRTGYFNISSGSYTARNNSNSYYIYQIDTFD